MKLAEQDMDLLARDTLEELTDLQNTTCVSIYMPTHRRGRDVEQDPIRLKNLVAEAESQLLDSGMRRPDVEELLRPLQERVDDYEFWQHQSDGLALFRAEDAYRQFRLPVSFEERAVVDQRPYVKPLIGLLAADGRFYILALSQDQVRLFEATHLQIGEVALPDTPESLAEAMRFDEFESQLQYHTGTGVSDGGERAALFHGHSDAGNEAVVKENLKRFLRMVDNGVANAVEEQRTPLVLAGVEMIRGLYREVSHYPTIVEQSVDGSPDDVSPRKLHKSAWPLVEDRFRQEQKEAADRFFSLAGNEDGRASADIEEIIPAAYYERIDTLFLTKGVEIWGEFDPAKSSVSVHDAPKPGDTELSDFAAVHTLRNGGRVFVVSPDQVPNESVMAAIFRFAAE